MCTSRTQSIATESSNDRNGSTKILLPYSPRVLFARASPRSPGNVCVITAFGRESMLPLSGSLTAGSSFSTLSQRLDAPILEECRGEAVPRSVKPKRSMNCICSRLSSSLAKMRAKSYTNYNSFPCLNGVLGRRCHQPGAQVHTASHHRVLAPLRQPNKPAIHLIGGGERERVRWSEYESTLLTGRSIFAVLPIEYVRTYLPNIGRLLEY